MTLSQGAGKLQLCEELKVTEDLNFTEGYFVKKLLEIGNRYAEQSDWKDFALTKICLCAMGILIGVKISENKKKPVAIISCIAFLGTYALLMTKVFKIVKEMLDK